MVIIGVSMSQQTWRLIIFGFLSIQLVLSNMVAVAYPESEGARINLWIQSALIIVVGFVYIIGAYNA